MRTTIFPAHVPFPLAPSRWRASTANGCVTPVAGRRRHPAATRGEGRCGGRGASARGGHADAAQAVDCRRQHSTRADGAPHSCPAASGTAVAATVGRRGSGGGARRVRRRQDRRCCDAGVRTRASGTSATNRGARCRGPPLRGAHPAGDGLPAQQSRRDRRRRPARRLPARRDRCGLSVSGAGGARAWQEPRAERAHRR